VISDFRREVDANSSLLGYYAENSGNLLPTFRDILSTPSSGDEMEPIGCPETSVRNYHYSLGNDPEGRSSHLLWVDSRAPRLKITRSYLPYRSNEFVIVTVLSYFTNVAAGRITQIGGLRVGHSYCRPKSQLEGRISVSNHISISRL
jgi:hypothetical protein